MTTTNPIKQQQVRRMRELVKLSRQRYLEAGGNPHRSTNGNEWMTQEEKQEYLTLARQVYDQEAIAHYLQKHGTWRDRFQAMKATLNSDS
jgi:hypothetical protein